MMLCDLSWSTDPFSERHGHVGHYDERLTRLSFGLDEAEWCIDEVYMGKIVRTK